MFPLYYYRSKLSQRHVPNNHLTILNFDSKERNMIYNLADVFVSPIDSIQETFGLTPIEAMCAGIHQIVSNCGKNSPISQR